MSTEISKQQREHLSQLESDELWLKIKCNTSEGPYLLPFAPNDKWNQASVFIVGLNPIISFRDEFKSFEHYWLALTRDASVFTEHYRRKYPRGQGSRTNKRIAQLIGYLNPLNVLVTNTFAYPATNPALIPKHIRKEAIEERILTRLFLTCRPKAVLFHGAEARDFGEKYFKVRLNSYCEPLRQAVTSCIPGTNSVLSLFTYHHFVGRVEIKEVMDVHLKQFAERIRHCVTIS